MSRLQRKLMPVAAGLITGAFGAPADLETQQRFFDRHLAPWARLFFEDLEGADSARVMAISTHPYITGVPHRIKYFDMALNYIRRFKEVEFMTGSEILDWYNSVA